jgi:tight adherence protein C
MGMSRRVALLGLSERTGVQDIVSFVASLNQAEELGVSIGRVLAVQAEELRVRRRQRAQERANQAPIKMMFPLVFLIFPAIFAVLLGPAVPQLFRSIGGGK